MEALFLELLEQHRARERDVLLEAERIQVNRRLGLLELVLRERGHRLPDRRDQLGTDRLAVLEVIAEVREVVSCLVLHQHLRDVF